MLIGAIVGAFLGGILWGWRGALTLGFLGWLTGLVVQSNRKKPVPGTPQTALRPTVTYEARIAQLEKRVAQLEAQLATPAGLVTPAELVVPSALVVPAEAGTQATETWVPASAGTTAAAQAGTQAPLDSRLRGNDKLPRGNDSLPRGNDSLLDRLLEGNLVAKLGVVILFFGVAFLLRFAYERGVFPPWMRLITVAVAASVMLFVGRKLLASRRTYALVLMGGAMGLAYLDVFFALKTFQYIGPAAAFTLFAALGIATLLLAVRLDARAIAALGMLGGFLAPILASTGEEHHVLLFSYYLVLNLVILATSWFRSWRELNFIGFLFTFAIGALWGHESYRPEFFATTEPFLAAFFAMYLAIPILFSFRQPAQLRGIVDGTLVFGTPLTAALMQTALTRGMADSVLAWSAAILAVVYGILAALLWRREHMRVLAEAHLALAVVFGTVAPYFAFGGYPTFAFWTIEGAAIYWIGCRQGSRLARLFAIALQLGGAAYFMWVTRNYHSPNAVLNEIVVGCVIVALAGLVTARSIATNGEALLDREHGLEGPAVGWAMLWLLAAAWYAIIRGLDGTYAHHAALLGTLAVLEIAVEAAGTALAWAALRRGNLVLRAGLAALALYWFWDARNPLEQWMWAGWAAAIAAGYATLWRQERDGVSRWAGAQLVALGWVTIGTLAHAMRLYAYHHRWGEAWQLGLPALIFAAALAAFVADWRRKRWPVTSHAVTLRAGIAVPLLVIAALWTLFANVACDGDANPWPYWPIANPLDLGQLALLAAAAWTGSSGGPVEKGMNVLPAVAIGTFWWVNGLVLRTVHQWTGVPYDIDPMLASVVAQTALSLLWTVTALAVMFTASRRGLRTWWMIGAALLGVVVLKLFLNDLGNSGTVARIVSFIGVGVLMLLIGFVSPVPPRAAPQTNEPLP